MSDAGDDFASRGLNRLIPKLNCARSIRDVVLFHQVKAHGNVEGGFIPRPKLVGLRCLS
jgi:hypothetical protein